MASLWAGRPEILGFLALSLCFVISRHRGMAISRGEQSPYKGIHGDLHENVFRKKLVVFLADGLRWDYVDRAHYPEFRSLQQRGFRAGRLLPVFPSVSYPNWYSLATGLYTEEHGILGNYMYDMKTNSYFAMSSPGSFHPRWWSRAEPLWTRALRRNRTVAMYWWDGCQVSINGTRPQRCIPYGGYSTQIDHLMNEKIEEVVGAFKKNALDLAMLYYEGPDAEGHRNGPESEGTYDAVKKVDRYLWNLQLSLQREDLLEEVNIIVVSDHGMTRTSPESTRHIDMDALVNERDVHIMLDKGPFAMLHPKPGRDHEVLKNLLIKKPKGLSVYTKETLPDDWHFKNNELVAPIVLVAQEGHYIMPFKNPKKTLPGNNGPSPGVHGYDPIMPDMWGIFYAQGPAIQGGNGGPSLVRMVDVYNLMCYMLGMDPAPNSGSWNLLKGFVNPRYDPNMYNRLY
nr:glycerophosphocholine choline phosphodiesterase ENPP6-like isoform X1 [Rhipicephalus microplus]